MNKKELVEFKKKAIAKMPLRKAEKEHIAEGHYLHQIHFTKVPDDEQEKKKWLKQEFMNYFALRCIGSKLWKEGVEPIEGHEHPLFTDKEFEDMLLLFQLPNIY